MNSLIDRSFVRRSHNLSKWRRKAPPVREKDVNSLFCQPRGLLCVCVERTGGFESLSIWCGVFFLGGWVAGWEGEGVLFVIIFLPAK